MEKPVNKSSPPPSEAEQLRALLAAMESASQGHFSHRLPIHGTHPLLDQIAEAFNATASRHTAFMEELASAARSGHELLGTQRSLASSIRGLGQASASSNKYLAEIIKGFSEALSGHSQLLSDISKLLGEHSRFVSNDTIDQLMSQQLALAEEVQFSGKDLLDLNQELLKLFETLTGKLTGETRPQ